MKEIDEIIFSGWSVGIRRGVQCRREVVQRKVVDSDAAFKTRPSSPECNAPAGTVVGLSKVDPKIAALEKIVCFRIQCLSGRYELAKKIGRSKMKLVISVFKRAAVGGGPALCALLSLKSLPCASSVVTMKHTSAGWRHTLSIGTACSARGSVKQQTTSQRFLPSVLDVADRRTRKGAIRCSDHRWPFLRQYSREVSRRQLRGVRRQGWHRAIDLRRQNLPRFR